MFFLKKRVFLTFFILGVKVFYIYGWEFAVAIPLVWCRVVIYEPFENILRGDHFLLCCTVLFWSYRFAPESDFFCSA